MHVDVCVDMYVESLVVYVYVDVDVNVYVEGRRAAR